MMGKFEDMHPREESVEIEYVFSKEIDEYLESLGFRKDTPPCSSHGEKEGWVNSYRSECGAYSIYVHLAKDEVSVYKTYSCGGNIYDYQEPIKFYHIESLEAFKAYADRLYESINFD